ncbi:flagellar assembly protein FliX [Magnetovibrio sp. PR-2]|uniref:flagellar assembly protein FliX n=1 Tax=Magnetovibrio sp. PR-2 TaxID=3120356 RepID=UPI002FCDF15E
MAMKIGNVSGSKGVGGTKRKKSASGAGSSAFADQLRSAGGADGAAPAEGVVGTSALEGVDALLAMQEVGDSTEENNRKQAQNYASDLLDRLARIQDALLRGGIAKEDLMQLAKRIREGRAKIQDPRLNEILDEIELRAEVEIAKYTRGL